MVDHALYTVTRTGRAIMPVGAGEAPTCSVRGRVNLSRDFVRRHQVSREGRQERLSCFDGPCLIEPVCLILPTQDHRHPGMDVCHELVGRRRENGKRRFPVGMEKYLTLRNYTLLHNRL
jgi:hypothetical protein